MIEGHGADLHRYKGLVRVDFSSNIYPRLNLSALKRRIAARLDTICRYPEPEPVELERTVARLHGVSPEHVIATNGATAAIYLIAQSLAHGDGGTPAAHIISQPTFCEYADACRQNGITPLADDMGVAGRKVYWLCNPNNPTGSYTDASLLLRKAENRPTDIFIIDQSYWRYTHERPILAREAVLSDNILLINSFSKDYSVPGLRIGSVIGSRVLVDRIRRFRQPWSVGALEIEAGLHLCEEGDTVSNHLDGLLAEARRLRMELGSINGVTAFDTCTNFMLCRLEHGSAARLKDSLVREHGLLIRDASNFSGLDSRYFRVAAQTQAEDDDLIRAIKEYISKTVV